jgi:malonyl-CoA decarboxylase
VPGFTRWLRAGAPPCEGLDPSLLGQMDRPGWHLDTPLAAAARAPVMRLAVDYLLRAKSRGGLPLDPVARFHLGNGARLEHIHWLGDRSAKGLREGAGLMVNYLYDPGVIERNHEAYSNHGVIAASPEIIRQSRRPAAPSR